jgi:outer membrane protein OmpA-like peptidoglycan-associated protein
MSKYAIPVSSVAGLHRGDSSSVRGPQLAAALAMLCLIAGPASAQHPVPSIPLAPSLTLVQTLREGAVERESVVRLADVSPAGVRYEWSFLEVSARGDTSRGSHGRFVRTADLDTAPRWHQIYDRGDTLEHPGYTAFTVSRAVFDRLASAGSSPFSLLGLAESSVGGLASLGLGGGPALVRWRGTLTRVGSGPLPFPLLVDGKRVNVPALHLEGKFTARGESWTPQLWVLAERDHPLILELADSRRVFQTVRADLGGAAAGEARALEGALARSCRVEVPGIYFESASAVFDPASNETIAALARMLARHADWTVTIEGHTDSIGTSTVNAALSERRANAVRARLTSQGVAPSRLRAIGYGQTRPRESNATIEGRARNRRVELLRPCGGSR